jgi:hypothetical protein
MTIWDWNNRILRMYHQVLHFHKCRLISCRKKNKNLRRIFRVRSSRSWWITLLKNYPRKLVLCNMSCYVAVMQQPPSAYQDNSHAKLVLQTSWGFIEAFRCSVFHRGTQWEIIKKNLSLTLPDTSTAVPPGMWCNSFPNDVLTLQYIFIMYSRSDY